MRQFKFFAFMDLIFNNTRYIVFYAILEKLVLLLLNFNKNFFASIGRANNIDNTVFLIENTREFLHFQRNFPDGITTMQVKHRIQQRNKKRVRLFLREYNLENAITQKISVLVHFLIFGKVLRILFHILKHFIVLRTIHILIHPAERDVLFEWLNKTFNDKALRLPYFSYDRRCSTLIARGPVSP